MAASVPSFLSDLLAGHGGGGQQQQPPAGLPASIVVPARGGAAAGQGDETEPLRILAQMITDAKRYIDAEPDAEDRATMGKVLQTLLQYQAKDQRDREAAMGGGPATRVLRKFG